MLCYEMTCNVMKWHSMWCNVIEYYDLQYFAMPSLTISLKCYLKCLKITKKLECHLNTLQTF